MGKDRTGIRQEILRELDSLLHMYPDLRVFQLLGNAVPVEESEKRSNDMYYVTDEELLEWLRSYPERVEAARRIGHEPS